MENIEYVDLQEVDQRVLLSILNKPQIRHHLVKHKPFDVDALDTWVNDKIRVDASLGCKVKAIKVDGALAGWCGIQYEQGRHEIAIVLDNEYWGAGVQVFKQMMAWAFELGHNTVVLHLLHTRPEYRFLKKMAVRVYSSTLFGQPYTSYELVVPTA